MPSENLVSWHAAKFKIITAKFAFAGFTAILNDILGVNESAMASPVFSELKPIRDLIQQCAL